MLIKAVTKKGDAIPYSAEEALRYAIQYGVKSQNTGEFVFWVGNQPIEKEKFQAHNDAKTQKWSEAFATGYAYVGKTRVKDDKFFKAKKHYFSVQYKLAKDSIGIPDIAIVDFTMTELETNPTASVGKFVIQKNESLPVEPGEIVTEKLGEGLAESVKEPVSGEIISGAKLHTK